MTQDAANTQTPQIRQQADDRLVHALLLHLHEDATERREQQVWPRLALSR